MVSKARRRRRRRHVDDSSSCSSTEALDQQSDDLWNDNPLYSDQRRLRQTKSRALRQTPPHTDRAQLSKSSVDLGHSSSSPPANVPLRTSSSTVKCEPDLTAVDNTVIVQDLANMSELDVCRGSMIDCISVAAPDDTVIKPSQLRASMRQRRSPSSTDDLATHSASDAARRHDVQRGGSVRGTKWTTSADRRAVSSVSSPAYNGIVSRSAPVSTSKSPTGSVPPPAHNNKTDLELLPSFPLSRVYTRSPTKSGTDEANGVGSLSYEQLLHEFNEVCYVTHTCNC